MAIRFYLTVFPGAALPSTFWERVNRLVSGSKSAPAVKLLILKVTLFGTCVAFRSEAAMRSPTNFSQVEEIIRHSEVMAVVRALRSGQAPRLGTTVDYVIEAPSSEASLTAKTKPYRVTVEQWHLDAARRMLASR